MPNNKLILRSVNSPWVSPFNDITTGSVLSWADVDNNFIYLKGEIIHSGYTNNNQLILQKINGNTINLNLAQAQGDDGRNRWYVPSNVVVEIPSDYQSFIYGDLYVEGLIKLNDNSQLVVLNGDIIMNGGSISGNGTTISVELPSVDTRIVGINYSSDTLTIFDSTGGTFNVSGFYTGGTDNFYTTGVTLNGNILEYNRNDLTNAYSVDLSQFKFTGNTSGDCIVDLFVSNIHSCSPLHINPNNEGDVYFGSNSGVTINTGSGKLITNEFNSDIISATTYLNLPNEEWVGGAQYILVKAKGTDIENAAELQAAYTTAQSMSPSATNRVTIVAAPGNYNFNLNFFMGTQYIDLVSLDGNRSIIFNGSGTILVSQNNIFIKGVNVLNKNFLITTNLNLIHIENCQGGNNSFGGDISGGLFPINVNGKFVNCQGGNGSFGGGGTASGVFINCVGGNNSFGRVSSGSFTNCQGGDNSFGYAVFFATGTASGNFNNCIGGNGSFGGNGTASGTFTECIAFNGSFGGLLSSGVFTNCRGGIGSFGSNGSVSGVLNNCISDAGSFGGLGGEISGKLYYCKLTSGEFGTLIDSGKIVLSIDGDDNIINQVA
jgi:hypothetical protein